MVEVKNLGERGSLDVASFFGHYNRGRRSFLPVVSGGVEEDLALEAGEAVVLRLSSDVLPAGVYDGGVAVGTYRKAENAFYADWLTVCPGILEVVQAVFARASRTGEAGEVYPHVAICQRC